VRDSVEIQGADELRADIQPAATAEAGEARRCLECRHPLGTGDRKVHRGACQRARKTRLQKLARGRRRP